MPLQIDYDKCKGCGLCKKACPFEALLLNQENKPIVDPEKCTLCGACVDSCQFKAITLKHPEQNKPLCRHEGDICVYCECTPEGELLPVSLELIGEALRLTEGRKQSNVTAILIGHHTHTATQQLQQYPIHQIYRCESEKLRHFDDVRYTHCVTTIIKQSDPAVFLGPATALGRALLPRVAVALKTGLTADCTELAIDDNGILLQTRPAFGGNILATIKCEHTRPQMATVSPGVFKKPQQGTSLASIPAVLDIDISTSLPEATLRVCHYTSIATKNNLHDARIVVAAGYGVGSKEGVERVKAFADAIGGALAVSRAVVDAGWADYAYQVGQTGITIQPELYIACGISGAIQHLVGMQNSGKIVAINRDAEAPIFQHADMGIIAPVDEALPHLQSHLSKSR